MRRLLVTVQLVLLLLVAVCLSPNSDSPATVKAQQPTSTPWPIGECPDTIPSGEQLRAHIQHAAAILDFEDTGVVYATELMEAALPAMNSCDDPILGSALLHSSQVMWIVRTIGSTEHVAEIGIRRYCGGGGPQMRLYFSCCAGSVADSAYFHYRGSPIQVRAQPGAKYLFSIKHEPGATEQDPGYWAGQAKGPIGGTGEAEFEPIRYPAPTGFTYGDSLHVGGETTYFRSDLGVSGHLNPRYMLKDDLDYYTMWGDDGVELVGSPPRYYITEGSDAGAEYYQVYSDVHSYATPTPTTTPDPCH